MTGERPSPERRTAKARAALDELVAALAAETARADEAVRDRDRYRTYPSGEGGDALRKAREGGGLTALETLDALRAAMEVADAAKDKGIALSELLREWLVLADLPGGGYGGTLEARTRAALAALQEAPPNGKAT